MFFSLVLFDEDPEPVPDLSQMDPDPDPDPGGRKTWILRIRIRNTAEHWLPDTGNEINQFQGMMKKDFFIYEGVTRDLPSEATGKSKSSKYCEVS